LHLTPTTEQIAEKRFLIMGNPNSGKTALFNRLTGRHHKISNFPGVTVERRTGYLKNRSIRIDDLPGAYSLKPQGFDEQIVAEIVHGWRQKGVRPDGIILVVDATNFSRTMFFALQVMEWDIPSILVINMIDEARDQGVRIDTEKLQLRLGADAVICTSAKSGEGIDRLIDHIEKFSVASKIRNKQSPVLLNLREELAPLQEITDVISGKIPSPDLHPVIDAIRMVESDDHITHLGQYFDESAKEQFLKQVRKVRETLHLHGMAHSTLESDLRYLFIDQELAPLVFREENAGGDISEQIDRVLTHPVWGFALMIAILGLIFNAIFSWAEYPMTLIEEGLAKLTVFLDPKIGHEMIRSLVIDGIIAGVGNVIVFLPQILLLIFFLGILEDSGYMARISFMMDRIMNKFGLHGKSILPMLSGFACAIPATMAARTIENVQDRLKLILLIPLMSCSARLPVYTLLISAFIPATKIMGFVSLQGLVLLGLYLLGFITALVIALVLKFWRNKRSGFQFIMELPPYRRPLVRSLWWRVFDTGKVFLLNAGTIILAVSIILWFLASYPRSGESGKPVPVKESYIGMIGRQIEPVISPLGFDWKIGVGLVTSFAAREVIISTFATIYNIEAQDQETVMPVKQALLADRYPDGRPVFTPLVALSLMVFFVYAAQCMSTFAVVKRETNSWKWPLIMVLYMNTLAYLAALTVYQGGKFLGIE
jgi:ferrous iron transport protein B